MRIGYADPPYPGCAYRYRDHPDYAGEVDHAQLIDRLEREFDGWVLHTHSPAIPLIAPLLPDGVRWGAWVKSFANFGHNVHPAFAWEPVIFKQCRRILDSKKRAMTCVMRDWVSASMTLRRTVIGAKPEAVCHWAFEIVGAEPDDELVDLFPGSGAVTRAWEAWRPQLEMALREERTSAQDGGMAE